MDNKHIRLGRIVILTKNADVPPSFKGKDAKIIAYSGMSNHTTMYLIQVKGATDGHSGCNDNKHWLKGYEPTDDNSWWQYSPNGKNRWWILPTDIASVRGTKK